MIFFGGHFTVKKTRLPCLLGGSLSYKFSGKLINKQYVKRDCGKIVSSYRKLLFVGIVAGK